MLGNLIEGIPDVDLLRCLAMIVLGLPLWAFWIRALVSEHAPQKWRKRK